MEIKQEDSGIHEMDIISLAELFTLLSEPNRIRVLILLFKRELCVGELADQLEMTHSAVSHQLRLLKTDKLVRSRREGKQIYYVLADEHVRELVEKGCEHVLKKK